MDNKKKSGTSIITLLVIALTVILVFVLAGQGNPGKKLEGGLTQIESLIDNGYNADAEIKIKDMHLEGGMGYIRVVDSKISDNYWPNSSDYYFAYSTGDEVTILYNIVSEFNANVDKANGIGLDAATEDAADYAAYKDATKINFGTQVASEGFLTTIMPYLSLLLFIILGFVMFRMLTGKSGGAGGFAKSKAKLTEKTNIKFKDIAGADEEKAETQEIVEFLKNPGKFKALGARIPKGVLLVGPPGTGKTLLAKAVAGESEVPFFSISGSDFVELYVGVGAGRVRDLFDTAKKNAPCILFIDEIDAVGRQRGAGLGGGNDEREQTLNQLLVEMDGFESYEGIIVLAATNRADVLDPALLRAGRFDRQIYVNVPDVKGREGIMKIHSKNKPIDPSVDFNAIARLTSGFTGADIENFLNEAAILAARDNRLTITMEDLTEGINKVLIGPQKKSRIITEEDKRITAYHEAGHAILAKMLNYGDAVHEVSIIPRGMAGGFTSTRPEKDSDHLFYNKLCDKISMTMGGRIAEEIKFKDITAGASSDIKHATDIARRMITEWGMSKKLGFVNLGATNEVFIGRDYQTTVPYSEKTASIIDEEVKAILESCYAKGKKLLQDNMKILDNMSMLLIEKETIYQEEVEAIIAGKNYKDVVKSLEIKEAESKARQAEHRKKAEQENVKKMYELKLKAAEALNNVGVISKEDLDIIKKEAEEAKQKIEEKEVSKVEEIKKAVRKPRTKSTETTKKTTTKNPTNDDNKDNNN